ncbi:MAG: ATP-binding protein [Candidatus Omnitrophota bacterium]|nr:ATP-binding protein [Candidatus Omnitrophota bacterium]
MAPKVKDINKVISDSIELTQYQLKAGDIKLIKDYGIRLPAVYIDEDQMKQVFVNVTLNSIQAMPRGGDLIFRTFTQRLKSLEEITVRGAEDFFNIGEPVVIVEIEDTGIGIPEDKLGKIFDPFFTSKRPDKGMGLGLSITQTIIRNHRGSIRIEGKQGKGTRVSITLSAATEKGW